MKVNIINTYLMYTISNRKLTETEYNAHFEDQR